MRSASPRFLLWWSTILPSNDRDFAPDVAHGVTGIVQGDELTLKNVRNFSWASPTDFTENWETRSYDLSKVESADFYLVYFMGPLIAHSMVSFGFADGRHLMFSIEIRKQRGEAFSAIAGFFKRYELVFLAADERDFLFLRKAAGRGRAALSHQGHAAGRARLAVAICPRGE